MPSNDDLAKVCREWTPRSLVTFYRWVYQDLGFTFPPHLLPVAYGLCDTRISKLALIIGPGSGKALHPDTPVYTPQGKRPIGSLVVGDYVVTPHGSLTRVLAVMPQPPAILYAVHLRDGREIVANGEHLWRFSASGGLGDGVKTTRDLWFMLSRRWRRVTLYPPSAALLVRLGMPASHAVAEVEGITLGAKGPSVCISVEAKDGLFLCGEGVTTHNSQLLSITYPTWLLGHDPTQTILCVSGAEDSAGKFMSAGMDIVQGSPAYKLAFPGVRPDKEAGWSSASGMYVTGRKPGVPDPSFYAAGLTSRTLTSKHAKTIILDDLHNAENSATEGQCQAVVDRYYSNLLGRADPMGCRFILAGRRWHEKDIYGHIQGTEEWVTMRLPAERPGATLLYHDITIPDELECVFTDRKVHCADGTVVSV